VVIAPSRTPKRRPGSAGAACSLTIYDGAIVLGGEQTTPVFFVPVEAGGDRNDLVGRRAIAALVPRPAERPDDGRLRDENKELPPNRQRSGRCIAIMEIEVENEALLIFSSPISFLTAIATLLK